MKYLKFITGLAVGLIVGLYGSSYLYSSLFFDAVGGEEGMLSFLSGLENPGSNTHRAPWYVYPLALAFYMFFSFLGTWFAVRISPIGHKLLAFILGGVIGIMGASFLAVTAGSMTIAFLNVILSIFIAFMAVRVHRGMAANRLLPSV